MFILLYVIVVVTLIQNIIQLFTESKRLKAEGKTPLVKRNLIVVGMAAIAEALVITLAWWLWGQLGWAENTWNTYFVWIAAYLLKNVGAYLMAWGLWSIFVARDRKKLMKQIKEDQEKAL